MWHPIATNLASAVMGCICSHVQATRLGIWVSNIPSAGTGNAASCAEHAVYLMLATLRHHHEMAASIAQRRLGAPMGFTLLGRSVLVLGFGNIAKELVVR